MNECIHFLVVSDERIVDGEVRILQMHTHTRVTISRSDVNANAKEKRNEKIEAKFGLKCIFNFFCEMICVSRQYQ